MTSIQGTSSLLIVDMQKYYLSEDSVYYKYFNRMQPGGLNYIIRRCRNTVIPNIKRLISYFQERDMPVIYLCLCSSMQDRSDLHRFFKLSHDIAAKAGYDGLYPMCGEPMSEIVDEIAPRNGSGIIFQKTTFSGFASGGLDKYLAEKNISMLTVTGLATSQCVDTTARDASDRGLDIIHISDAQADYDELTHDSSLYASRAVCGGAILETETLLRGGYGEHENW